MASLDAGYDRAAMLKQAARRNHFASRIEKYEAKVKQDLKARGLLREERVTMAPAFLTRRRALEQRLPSMGKAISGKDCAVEDRHEARDFVMEKAKHGASLERKICHSGERQDSSEQNIIATIHGHHMASAFFQEKEKLKNDDALLEGSICQSGETEGPSDHKSISEQREISHSVVHDHKACYLDADKAKPKKDNKLLAHKLCHLGEREESSRQKFVAEQKEVLHSIVYDHKTCDLVPEKAKIMKNNGLHEHKTCPSGDGEDSPEQKIIAEQREICVQHRFSQLDRHRVTTSSSIIHHPGNIYASETKAFPGQSFSPCKPPASSELNISAIAMALKIRLKAADMSPPMQEHAFRLAREILNVLDKLQCKRVAYTLKKEFDNAYGPAWHCIVGTNFGSYVTHSLGGFIYFSLDKVSVLLFKTAVEPLEN